MLMDDDLDNFQSIEEDSILLGEFCHRGESSETATARAASEDDDDFYLKFQDRGWTDEEDALLLSLVQELGTSGQWREICARLNRCDEKECESRYIYQRSLAKGSNYWTKDEENLLRRLLRTYDGNKPNWKAISSYIPTRTCAAIKTHWRELKMKEKKLSMAEDATKLMDSSADSYEAYQEEQTQYQDEWTHHRQEVDHDDEIFAFDYYEPHNTMLPGISSVRCNSEDSQATYLPDADPNFGRSDISPEEYDTDIYEAAYNEYYPCSKRFRSDSDHNSASNGNVSSSWPIMAPELITSAPSVTYPMRSPYNVLSTDTSPSSSFHVQTTRSSSDQSADNFNSYNPASQPYPYYQQTGASYEYWCDHYVHSHDSLNSAPLEDDDLVSSFIETFAHMDDEETRAEAPFHHNQAESTQATTATMIEYKIPSQPSEQNLFANIQQHQRPYLEQPLQHKQNQPLEKNVAHKRPITSWEKAKNALPHRLEKRHSESRTGTKSSLQTPKADDAKKTNEPKKKKPKRTKSLCTDSKDKGNCVEPTGATGATSVTTAASKVKRQKSKVAHTNPLTKVGDKNEETDPVQIIKKPIVLKTKTSKISPVSSNHQDTHPQPVLANEALTHDHGETNMPHPPEQSPSSNQISTLTLSEFSNCVPPSVWTDNQETAAVPSAAAEQEPASNANPYHMIHAPNMLVYVPCVYMNTPTQTMAYSATHPSMLGLHRPPPGFRLIQAPALVQPQLLPFVPYFTIPPTSTSGNPSTDSSVAAGNDSTGSVPTSMSSNFSYASSHSCPSHAVDDLDRN